MRYRLLLLFISCLISSWASADVFRPAYLELREIDGERYEVLWKVPVMGGNRRLSARVVFPEAAAYLDEPRAVVAGNAWFERYRVQHPGGLAGQTVAIAGKLVGVTDIIARVERLDGSAQVERLSVARPVFTVKPPQSHGEIAWAYFVLGVEHILGGIDHLLFVLALLLVVRGTGRLIATITAFTAAHSLTLVAATLGWVNVPGPPVEAIIALSIVFVAAEVIAGLHNHEGLTARSPWVVAFSFGLLHGLGFAGALAEVGLPQVAVPVALLMFNAGVEVGQLLFVAGVVLLRRAVTAALPLNSRRVSAATAYGIGGVAAFWTIERVVGFWA